MYLLSFFFIVNRQAFLKLKQELASKLQSGCEDAANIIKDVTPIDTKRLWTSTRADEVVITSNCVQCRIVAGGEALYGVLREQDILKEVDYAIYVESRTSYIRSSLKDIKNAILDKLSE